MQNQPPVLTIKMVVPGVELVLHALSKLPYEQSAGLIAEVKGQAEYQLQELQAAQGANAPAATNPSPEVEQAAEASSDAAAEAAVGGTD